MEIEAPRRSCGSDTSHDSDSCPEFEFWMVGNHPQLELGGQLTADELFVDGVLLPLRLLSFSSSNTEPEPLSPPTLVPREPETTEGGVGTEEEPSSSITSAPITSSKRWKDIFKKSNYSSEEMKENKSSKKERKGPSGGGGPELNINIWPFSRSRSAGTTGGRPKPSAVAMGMSSSAPCSRSNSRGERKWAASPGRAGGVHVGRASSVWQVRHGGGGRAAAAEAKAKVGPRRKAGGPSSGVRGLNLAPLNGCIGYRRKASCRGDEEEAAALGGANGSLFRFRGLFTNKVY